MNIFRTISRTSGDGPAVEEDGQASRRTARPPVSRTVEEEAMEDGPAIPIPLEAPTDKNLHKPYNIR